MTLNELLVASQRWADEHAMALLAGSVLLPIVGTLLAWLGRGGKTDRDGRFIASALMGVGMLAVVAEVFVLLLARSIHGTSPMDVSLALLAAPVLILVLSVIGIRLVFPLSELASVRSALDLLAFAVCCGAVAWIFSTFRGWGVVFFGSITQLAVVTAIAAFFVRRMFRRTFALDRNVGR
jgi:hypothetical protein